MFNKPTPNTREDAIPRNDIRNFLNPGAPAATQPVAELATKAAPQADSRSPAPVIASPAPLGQQSAAENKTSEARLIVGPDVKLKGAEILDCDTLVVEGRVEATMDSRVIRIAEQGSFTGKVSIDIAEIHGSFDGELTARCQLIIHATGRVSGKIRYGKLVIDEGGELCGDISTLSAEKSLQQRARNDATPALSAIGR
ncbi:MAG: polymer-forming cytoskeletal protein [Dechloromonas sp.]|uniref:Polymer-forming cytoskeletal protein n=1 Tax=Candidatus Dechloromonas phosphorivorans TaxID=2899244 RepID=A0A9D7LLE5_9RHOO|nr:polymer-forming cytoskeletal protein [Candidatus Dechloromonas phosphorivorans]